MSQHDLAPGLLLAAPALRDPNFARSVVVLGRHDGDGALGWVINGKELGGVRQLLSSSGVLSPAVVGSSHPALARRAHAGGPVAPSTGWILYQRTTRVIPGEMMIGTELAVTSEVAAFAAGLVEDPEGEKSPDFRLILGCAGWGAGQLEAEIGAGGWLPAELDPPLVFDFPVPALWAEAYQRSVGAAPATFTSRPVRA